MSQPPDRPRIYYIIHVNQLPSVIADGNLWCNKRMNTRSSKGLNIGMSRIKAACLNKQLNSHPSLCVGEFVPFYFCPRSVMLYLIHRNNPDLEYKGGQEPIIHLVADMHESIAWANRNSKRWAFTDKNAAKQSFNDYCDLEMLDQIQWGQ